MEISSIGPSECCGLPGSLCRTAQSGCAARAWLCPGACRVVGGLGVGGRQGCELSREVRRGARSVPGGVMHQLQAERTGPGSWLDGKLASAHIHLARIAGESLTDPYGICATFGGPAASVQPGDPMTNRSQPRARSGPGGASSSSSHRGEQRSSEPRSHRPVDSSTGVAPRVLLRSPPPRQSPRRVDVGVGRGRYIAGIDELDSAPLTCASAARSITDAPPSSS